MQKFICSLLLLLLVRSAFGWSGTAHMIIAAGAWRELPAETQADVADLLKAHPNYSKWRAAFGDDSGDVNLAAFVFMRCSTWPDEIRRSGSQFDHPDWHFVNYPLKPPSFPMEPAPAPTNDLLYAIQQCKKNIGDKNASAAERAVSMAWFVHLIGDLHQPLHCASLVNETYPEGDKGGNEFYVKPGAKGIRLHALWDDLLGTSGKPLTLLNYSIQIQGQYRRKALDELKKATTPKEWSLESRSLAIEKAYLKGDLKGSTSPDTAPDLPAGYTKTAKSVAEKQAALAGYRMADDIRELLK